jgi:hypothetical protein
VRSIRAGFASDVERKTMTASKVVWLSLWLTVLLSACASQPPLAEVRLVAKSFTQLEAASQPLLDDLAAAERAQGRNAAEVRAKRRTTASSPVGVGNAAAVIPTSVLDRCADILVMGGEKAGLPSVQTGFCLEDSYYYSELADPPTTRAFRRALAAVGDYTELLVILAEGRNLDEAKGQLQVLRGNLGVALGAAGVAGAVPGIATALASLEPLVDLAGKAANAKELERIVREESPKINKLIAALHAGAGELFTTVTEAPLARFTKTGLTNLEVARTEARRIEDYRAAVSIYVVLLEQYRMLLGDLLTSYDKPRSMLTLASLAERSAQLSAQADTWRRALAAARTGLR